MFKEINRCKSLAVNIPRKFRILKEMHALKNK